MGWSNNKPFWHHAKTSATDQASETEGTSNHAKTSATDQASETKGTVANEKEKEEGKQQTDPPGMIANKSPEANGPIVDKPAANQTIINCKWKGRKLQYLATGHYYHNCKSFRTVSKAIGIFCVDCGEVDYSRKRSSASGRSPRCTIEDYRTLQHGAPCSKCTWAWYDDRFFACSTCGKFLHQCTDYAAWKPKNGPPLMRCIVCFNTKEDIQKRYPPRNGHSGSVLEFPQGSNESDSGIDSKKPAAASTKTQRSRNGHSGSVLEFPQGSNESDSGIDSKKPAAASTKTQRSRNGHSGSVLEFPQGSNESDSGSGVRTRGMKKKASASKQAVTSVSEQVDKTFPKLEDNSNVSQVLAYVHSIQNMRAAELREMYYELNPNETHWKGKTKADYQLAILISQGVQLPEDMKNNLEAKGTSNRRPIDVPPASCKKVKDDTATRKFTVVAENMKELQATTMWKEGCGADQPKFRPIMVAFDEFVLRPDQIKGDDYFRKDATGTKKPKMNLLVPKGFDRIQFADEMEEMINQLRTTEAKNGTNWSYTEDVEEFFHNTYGDKNFKPQGTNKQKKKKKK